MADEQQEAQAAEATEESGSLLDQIIAETKINPGEEGYDEVKKGVQALVADLVKKSDSVGRIDRKVVDAMIAELDQSVSSQVNEIIHHSEFKERESAWRGLKFLVDRVNFRENMTVSLFQATKDELRDDFDDASDITTSGLYRHVYTAEFGQFGGRPYGCMIGNYYMGPNSPDIGLLRNCASVAAMAHAPFLSGVDCKMFGRDMDDFTKLPLLKDLDGVFEGPQYAKWRGLREADDSRWLGMCMPRYMARSPYKAEEGLVKSFNFEETIDGHDDYLWSNAAFAMASRIADSFAKYRWCPNIIGPKAGGAVTDLPIHTYESMGELVNKVPTETLISERREFELAENGFITLTMRKDSDNAAFFSANSLQKAKFFGQTEEGRTAETNYRLGTQLPYLFITSRLAHYLKVIQRENIGTWKERSDLEAELNNWIRQYVVAMEAPDSLTRSRYPLKDAQVTVEDVPGQPGWYKVDMKVVPHLKYMGASFTLSLVGKLDKS